MFYFLNFDSFPTKILSLPVSDTNSGPCEIVFFLQNLFSFFHFFKIVFLKFFF